VRATPLDPRWLTVIEAVARRVLGPFDRTGDALVHEIRQLSERYTRRGGAIRDAAVERAARLRFFVPRDLPKVMGPLAELSDAGALPAARRWRVLDLGAGMGTTSLGAAALAARLPEPPEALDVLAIEREAALLDVMRALAEGATREKLVVPMTLRAQTLDLTRGELPAGTFDLILMGLSLNELWPDAPDAIERRAALCASLIERLADDGSLIVIEPALHDTTRALMAVRDALQGQGAPIFAPCPAGTAQCPLLLRERDWCHEELPLALPPALAELAKRAGLRFEGLSYAYITLRRGASLSERLDGAARVVGGPIASKGRRELQLCTGGRMRRLNVLDRDGDRLATARRGTVLSVEIRADSETLRLGRDAEATARRDA
jgi:ribosomal protein RSM22 (predicted rRNA methylase)